MKKSARLLVLLLPLLWLGCEERTEETDSGGVLLEVEFTSTGVPVIISVNGSYAVTGAVTVGTMTVNSVIPNQTVSATDLMDVELEALEVTFRRADTGTRVPPPYVERLLSLVPAGGSLCRTCCSRTVASTRKRAIPWCGST